MPEQNTSSITHIVKKYSSQLLRFIRGKVGKMEDAEDVLQEVWYQLSRMTNINDLESVSGWLYYVTKNKITDLYRKKKETSLDEISIETADGEINFKEILLLDDTGNPELGAFKELFWKELMSALEELPEKQRQVFILNEIEDKTLQEIADIQNENIKTIISRKGYALKHLRKRLLYLYNDLNQ